VNAVNRPKPAGEKDRPAEATEQGWVKWWFALRAAILASCSVVDVFGGGQHEAPTMGVRACVHLVDVAVTVVRAKLRRR
jgi:hypothetical protein